MADKYAVLTGDVVRSSALQRGELERARDCLNAAAGSLAEADWARNAAHDGAIDWFRGDSWQWLIREPCKALRAAIFLRATLLAELGCDTRVAIGIGRVTRLETSRLSQSEGEAFSLSGRALDTMPAAFRMAMAAAGDASTGRWLDLVAQLCDSVMVQWEGRQVEMGRLAIRYPDYTHEQLGNTAEPAVSQQAVSKSLKTAGWAGIAAALAVVESLEELT